MPLGKIDSRASGGAASSGPTKHRPLEEASGSPRRLLPGRAGGIGAWCLFAMSISLAEGEGKGLDSWVQEFDFEGAVFYWAFLAD